MIHPVISNMISLSEPLIEAKNRRTNIQVYDMSHWFVSISGTLSNGNIDFLNNSTQRDKLSHKVSGLVQR